VLAQLFIDAAALASKIITFHMSYIEIYNEALFDLLGESSQGVTVTERVDVAILQGAAVVKLQNEKHAIDTFCRGEGARSKRAHALNAASSRSHAICTINIAIKNDPGDPQALLRLSLAYMKFYGLHQGS
jgi:kinesin family member 6/9